MHDKRLHICLFVVDSRLTYHLVFRVSCFMDYQCLRIPVHLRFGIILSLLFGIANCKYITESYFQKHDTLIDSVFQDFISNDLSNGFCETFQTKHKFSPKLSVLQRHLIGEGSHRRLTSSVKIENESKVLSKLPLLSCEAIIVERLPSGVFADPFELQHLTRRGGKILSYP